MYSCAKNVSAFARFSCIVCSEFPGRLEERQQARLQMGDSVVQTNHGKSLINHLCAFSIAMTRKTTHWIPAE